MNDNIQTTNTAPELPSRPNEIQMRQQLDQFNKIHKGDNHVGGHHKNKKKKAHHSKPATDMIQKTNTTPELPMRPASQSISIVL